jgi:sec-independent protein translocase protein TatB
MFDIGSTELLLIVVVAVVVIGPKDLPRALYKVGQVVRKARAMSRHFRTGIDAMIREAEIEELERKWRDQNARIMAEHPEVAVIEHMGEEPGAPHDGPASTENMPDASLPAQPMLPLAAPDGEAARPAHEPPRPGEDRPLP